MSDDLIWGGDYVSLTIRDIKTIVQTVQTYPANTEFRMLVEYQQNGYLAESLIYATISIDVFSPLPINER